MNYCHACGQKLEQNMKFCFNCGLRLNDIKENKSEILETKEARTSTLIIEKAEPIFYSDEKGVRITPTRLIIPSQNKNDGPTTFAMANISSVKTEKHDPNRLWGVLLGLVGLVAIFYSFNYTSLDDSNSMAMLIVGSAFAVAGLLWAVFVPITYHIKISSASGEVSVLDSKNKQYVNAVAVAINEALVNRG